jgi:hypothetical protein
LNCQFSRRVPDWATLRGAWRLTCGDSRMEGLSAHPAPCVSPAAMRWWRCSGGLRLGRGHDGEGVVGCRPARGGPRRHRETCAARSPSHVGAILSPGRWRTGSDSVSLRHLSIQTTERFFGCKQKLRRAVNDGNVRPTTFSAEYDWQTHKPRRRVAGLTRRICPDFLYSCPRPKPRSP